MTDTVAKAREIIADALEISTDEVDGDASIETLDAWTSLGHMRLILALEETLGKQLDPAAIVEIGNLNDVAAILNE
jgi:acyl carrier protein